MQPVWSRLLCLRLAVAMGLSLLMPSETPAYTQEQHIALLIGKMDYKESPLDNPVNDINAIKNALELRGWTAWALENPTVDEAQNAILKLADLANVMDQRSAVMVYFSGHGFQLGSDSYMYFDALSDDISNLIQNSISISDMLEPFERSEAAKLILIDACRSSPFGQNNIVSVLAGLTQIEAPNNSVIGFATAPYSVAYDSGGYSDRLSPYAQSVVAALATSRDIDDFFRSVRRATIIATDGKQVPWETSSLLQKINLGPIGSIPEQTISVPVPSLLTDQTVALATFNRQPTVNDDFASELALFLVSAVNAADLADILIWDQRRATEQDREDLISTIRYDLAASTSATFLGNYGIDLLGSDYGLSPACRKNGSLDFNCSDTDRKLFLPLNPEFAYKVNKASFELGGRTDGLATMYRDGIYVSQNYLVAYDIYLEAKGRTDGDRRLDEYYEVDVNTMAQSMLNRLGAEIDEDGDFGPSSCAALRHYVSGGGCGRIPSRAEIERLIGIISETN